MIEWKLINYDELMPKTNYLISNGTDAMVALFRGNEKRYKWEDTTDGLSINEPYFPIVYYAEINLP